MDKQKVKSIYSQLKSLKEQFEADKGWYHASVIRGTYNPLIDELTEAIGEDCSKFKVPSNAHQMINGTTSTYKRLPTLTHMGMVVAFLEDRLNISDSNTKTSSESGVTIINQNTLAVSIQNTISQLIDRASNDEEKEKLTELNEELEKSTKDWNKIKNILIWILNFSKDLFIQVLPELLKKM